MYLRGGLGRQVDAARLRVRLHARGRVDRVAEEAVARQLDAHHAADDRSAMDAHERLQRPALAVHESFHGVPHRKGQGGQGRAVVAAGRGQPRRHLSRGGGGWGHSSADGVHPAQDSRGAPREAGANQVCGRWSHVSTETSL